MRLLIGMVMALAAGGALADVNKCSVGGKVVFQDGPCPGSKFERGDPTSPATKAVEAKPLGIASAALALPSSTDGLKARLAVYERERHLRESQQRIVDLQTAITARNDQMGRELAALRDKKSRAANNLAGAQWEQSISGEMSAVTEKCRTLNEADLQEIASLRTQIADLQRQ